MRSQLMFSAAWAGLSLMPATGAFAQSAPATAIEGTEVVVVTAQRREERLQDVPLAVSAVSGNILRDLGVNSTTDLKFIAPSVNYGSSANTRGEGLAVRGVGTQIFGDGVEQSVGVVIDGVPMGRNGMGIGDMVDVDRLEVLRGPQGMLFGKNASAGLINVITIAPRLGETSLTVRGSYATLDDTSASLTANVALGEKAALRLSYQARERDGFVENIQLKKQLMDLNNQAFRVRFLADVTDNVRVQINGDAMNSNTGCCTWTARAAPATSAFVALNAAVGIVPSPTNLRNAASGEFFQNMDNWGLSSQVDVDFDWATLTAIASYRYWFAIDNNDPDILPINVLDRNNGDSTVDQNTFEIRLASPGDQNFEWTVGLFSLNLSNTGSNTQAGTLGANPAAPVLGYTRTSTTSTESQAIFGQIAYTFFDRVKLIAGARYTDEKLGVNWFQVQASNTAAPFPGRFYGSTTGSRKTDNTSWRVTAQYNFTDDIMVYGGASRGYKGPAYDQNIISPTVVFTEPEIPTSYEAGLRSSFFRSRLIFNVALFDTKFKNFQAQVFDQNVTPSRFITANAGELSTKGGEFEFRARPMPGLTIAGNLALIDATYTDFKNVACYLGQTQLPFGTVRTSPRECIRVSATGAFVTEGTGNPLTNSPETAGNISVSYERPIGAFTGFVGATYSYRDDVTFSAAGDPGAVQEAYGLIGARVGVRARDDRWSVTLFGRNLGDENFVNNVIGQPVLGAPGVYSQFPTADARRIVGISFDLKFGG
jgi:iron complex outermembrane recepter protein